MATAVTTRGRQRRAYRPSKPLGRVPTDDQVIQALVGSHRSEKALYKNRRDSCLKAWRIAADWFWSAHSAEAVSSHVVIAQHFFGLDEETGEQRIKDQADADVAWPTIWKVYKRLEQAGVMRAEGLRNAHGAFIGVRLELLDGWAAYADDASASSSAG